MLVNKFDQQDRNSDDADQVRALISGTLMKGCITPQQIFPVSSMWGYLANRARHELANNGKLPAPEQQRWVEDFAHAALGRRWRHDDLADLEHIRHAADQLWEDSLFAQPIQALLHAAYANASLYALRSAAHKLLNYAQQARGYLDFRAHGLNVACEQLRQNIHQVEESLQLLQLNQAQVSGEVKHEIELALTSANHFLRQQWNSSTQYEGGNKGHRPAVKGGYFPVPPVDSAQDIRSEMCLVMEQMGLVVEGLLSQVRPSDCFKRQRRISAWLPDSNTGGTSIPSNTSGRV